MSQETIGTNNGQQMRVDFDISKIFIWKNRYSSANYTNSTYNPYDQLVPGMALGRVSATGEVKRLNSTANDGSQYPCGIMLSDIEVAEGDTENVAFCIAGDVAESKIIFHGTDTLNTVVGGRIYRDWFHLLGIKPVPTQENTKFDN